MANKKIRCEARIVKTFKSRKANVIWPRITAPYPNSNIDPMMDNPLANQYPNECGGEITVNVCVTEEPEWGGSSFVLRVECTCTDCKDPYFEGIYPLMSSHTAKKRFAELVEQTVVAAQQTKRKRRKK